MKAVIYKKYGSANVLDLVYTPTPEPADNEVLVKIMATSVTQVDTAFRAGNPFIARLFTGLLKPKMQVLGTEFAGEIVKVGPNVTLFSEGMRVFAASPDGFGAHAQYICLSEDAAMVEMPETLSFEDAAVIDNGALTALPFLRDGGKLKAGQSILIIGAAGSIGTYAVQLASEMGAKVTGVCSGANAEMVLALGAEHVVDYTKSGYIGELKTYDVIFDTVGKLPFNKALKRLKPAGIFLAATPDIAALISPLFMCFRHKKRGKMMATGLRKNPAKIKDMNILKEMISNGQLTPIIDRSYPLEEIRAAHEYVEKGHKRGNLLITVSHERSKI